MSLLALTTRLTNYSTQSYTEKRDSLACDWANFIEETTNNPFFYIPNQEENIINLLNVTCPTGIILTGGEDIGIYPERDNTETKIITWALEKNIPVLGVCRGAQMINHYFKGSLENLGHTEHVATRHAVSWQDTTINDKKFSAEILPSEVNSFHNQAIFKEGLAKDLIPCATIFDKINQASIVEAFKHKNFPLYAIMWHIERERSSSFTKILFKNLFGVNQNG